MEDLRAILRAALRGQRTSAVRLNIFDFDGTLFATQAPETGKSLYQELTGRPWPYEGWWGKPESLRPPLPAPPGPALEDFRREVQRRDAITCMMTGRIPKLRLEIERIMFANQIAPHFSLFKTSEWDTAVEKCLNITELCRQLATVREVAIWDDNAEHAARFAALDLGPSVSLTVFLASPDGCRPLPLPPLPAPARPIHPGPPPAEAAHAAPTPQPPGRGADGGWRPSGKRPRSRGGGPHFEERDGPSWRPYPPPGPR